MQPGFQAMREHTAQHTIEAELTPTDEVASYHARERHSKMRAKPYPSELNAS